MLNLKNKRMVKLLGYPKPTLKERVAKIDADLTALRDFFNSLNVKINDKNKQNQGVKTLADATKQKNTQNFSIWKRYGL